VSADLELALQPDSSRLTLAHFLEDIEQRHGRSVALRFEGRDLRYDELAAEARRLARGLIAAGVCKGAHVAVLMANRPEWVTAAFAVALVGAVLVPVNTFATSEERDYILRHSDASLLLLQRDLLNHAYLDDLLRDHSELADGRPGRVYCKALPQLRGAFCLGLAERRGGVEPWAALAESADSVPEELLRHSADEIMPSDDAILIYTSGTTAHPKGVLHRQRAPVIQSYRFAEYMGLASDDCVFSAQPFFWTAGIAMSLGATLAAGARLVLQESFEPGAALDAIEAEGVTAIFCWPHQDKAMAEHPSISNRDLSRARKVEFRSPLAPLVGLEEDEWSTYASYGLSETFTLACAYPASTPADVRSGTHGCPLPGMQVRIVDPETGEPVGPDTPGEIAVKGATLMAGYYKVDPELYLDVDGFFRTQDGGSLDKHGVLHWTGRLSNLIKTGGANVSPLEIEGVLSQFSGLKAGLAVGIPHPTLGEAIVLCAVPTHDSAVEAEAVRAFLREKLAAYKVPRVVLLFADDELSYTGNQKIQSGPLRELALARAERDGIEIDGFRYRPGEQT
jgi:acyl-CoA synthetase (AMP-forming)/AMP-acid ligase II